MARACALSETKSFMNPPLNSSGAPGTRDLGALREPFDRSYFFFFFFLKLLVQQIKSSLNVLICCLSPELNHFGSKKKKKKRSKM